jgi:hypothetical protein
MKKNYLLLIAFLLGTISWQVNAQAVVENFDNYNSGDDPTGWTKYQTEADDPGFVVTDSKSHSVPNSLYHNDDNVANESTSWIVAPVYTSTGDDLLSFQYMQNFTESYYNYSGVWYSTTGSDPIANPGDWTQIAEFNDVDQPYSEDVWTEFMHSFQEAAGTTIYIAFKYTGDFQHEFYIDDFKMDVAPQYYNPIFTLNVVPDCSNGQFTVDVDVTDLGGASSVTIADDQNSVPQSLSAAGTVNFGPYPSGTNVTITVTSDNDATYTSSDSVEYFCPPANDTCDNAESLTVFAQGASAGNETAGDTTHANDSGVHPSCDDIGTNLDLWYSFTLPANANGVTVLTGGTKGDKIEAALYDTCGGQELACEDQSASKSFIGLTGGNTYILQVWHDEYYAGDFTIAIEEILVTNPVFELNVNPDCTNNQYSVDVNVTSLGGASSVTVTDDQGSASQQLTAPGTVSFGPYAVGTTVNFTVTSDDDATYTSTDSVQYFCPPANDNCANAISLTVADGSCGTPTLTTNQGATDSGEAAPSCASYSGGDVWFTITVPASGSVTVETSSVAGSDLSDTGMSVYSGTCGALTEIDCNDDGGSGTFSKIELSNQNPGDVLYVRVWEYNNDAFGEFNVCAYDPTVGISENNIEGFKFYPNPVNHSLHLSAKNNIEMVVITNLTGQEVIRMKPETTQSEIDMNHLQKGVYFVKAQINGQLTAFKVVKK